MPSSSVVLLSITPTNFLAENSGEKYSLPFFWKGFEGLESTVPGWSPKTILLGFNLFCSIDNPFSIMFNADFDDL